MLRSSVLLMVLLSASVLTAVERPNIVFVFMGDQAPWAIGLSGHPHAKTRHQFIWETAGIMPEFRATHSHPGGGLEGGDRGELPSGFVHERFAGGFALLRPQPHLDFVWPFTRC